jgi:hypothetical protein
MMARHTLLISGMCALHHETVADDLDVEAAHRPRPGRQCGKESVFERLAKAVEFKLLSLLLLNRLSYAAHFPQVTALLRLRKRHVVVGYFTVEVSPLLVEHSLVVLGLTNVTVPD